MSQWDPLKVKQSPLPHNVVLRIKKDIESICTSPVPGVNVIPDEEDISLVHALVSGPSDTPYEGGFFYFILRFPDTYPIKPPMAKLMNTGNGTIRFNPNLYAEGKVCLSILGTWSGPSWSPANTLSSVLLSIQSLLCSYPIKNEPGWESYGDRSQASLDYNAYLKHQTLRYALLDYVEGKVPRIPDDLLTIIYASFEDLAKYWETVCKENWSKDGIAMSTPSFDRGSKNKVFQYRVLYEAIQKAKQKLQSTGGFVSNSM